MCVRNDILFQQQSMRAMCCEIVQKRRNLNNSHFCRGKIIWADQQKTVKRYKRDYVSLADLEFEKPLTREKRSFEHLNAYKFASNVVDSEEENYIEGRKRMFNDELWDRQWYMVI